WRDFPGGSPFPLIKGAEARFTPYGIFQSSPYDIQTPATSSWNLTVQRQFAMDWLVSASYIGSTTVHVWAQEAINPAVYFPGGPCTINSMTYNTCSSTSNTNQRRILSLERPVDGQLIGLVGQI